MASDIPMCAIPVRNTRISSDRVWPLRGKDGLTYAERQNWQNTMMQRVKTAMEIE